jgi:hypothetical protein
MPNFTHSFDPPGGSSLGAIVDLTAEEVEAAGIREILQTPGAKMGHWGLLGPLLDPSSPDFIFLEPLGQSREVKTALSGLLGRLVARAYATKHLGLTHFAHVRKPPMRLDGAHGLLRRVAGATGDMPDWVAWGPGAGLAIVEAKGSHDPAGPAATLARAYAQANRAEIVQSGLLAPFKRYAIATRWGFNSPSWAPMLSVRDPDEDGEGLPDEEICRLEIGVIRRHFGELLEAVGERQLASALFGLTQNPTRSRAGVFADRARATLAAARPRRIVGSDAAAPVDRGLVGGFVSAGGALPTEDLSPDDVAVLDRLKLRPTFVGVEISALEAAIDGDLKRLKSEVTDPEAGGEVAGRGGSGDWVIPLGRGRPRVE